jgi:hypothetical protein
VGKKKTNLLVFLTPHIIREMEYLERLSRDKTENFSRTERLYESGELMIEFREGVTPEAAHSIITQHGGTVIEVREGGVYHIKLKKDQDVEEAVKKFSAIPEVGKVDPNYKIKIPR